MKSIFLILVCIVIILTGCTNNGISFNDGHIDLEKLEIYHFHKTNQCYSCKTDGA